MASRRCRLSIAPLYMSRWRPRPSGPMVVHEAHGCGACRARGRTSLPACCACALCDAASRVEMDLPPAVPTGACLERVGSVGWPGASFPRLTPLVILRGGVGPRSGLVLLTCPARPCCRYVGGGEKPSLFGLGDARLPTGDVRPAGAARSGATPGGSGDQRLPQPLAAPGGPSRERRRPSPAAAGVGRCPRGRFPAWRDAWRARRREAPPARGVRRAAGSAR